MNYKKDEPKPGEEGKGKPRQEFHELHEGITDEIIQNKIEIDNRMNLQLISKDKLYKRVERLKKKHMRYLDQSKI